MILTFHITWSPEDDAYLGRCLELESAVGHGDTEIDALKSITALAAIVLEDLTVEEFRNWKTAHGME